MTEQEHQSVSDAITDAAQVAGERPEDISGATMNEDDEVVEPGMADQPDK